MISDETWRALVDREEGYCQSCGEWDNLAPCHYIPVSRGGSDDLDNLWLGCFWCHRAQHDGNLLVKKINEKFYFKRK